MKFLVKDPASPILTQGLVYRSGAHNDGLLASLRSEQRGYCAYTEKRFARHDTQVVEHFNHRLKDTPADDYYNYYATLQSANQRKRGKEKAHADAAFFHTRFFQRPGAFERRVRYVATDSAYEEVDPADVEARDLVDFLGLNDHETVEDRRKHVARLRDIFEQARWPAEQQLSYLGRHPEELSYPTALAAELNLDVDALLPPAADHRAATT
jgi:hypothetical protein